MLYLKELEYLATLDKYRNFSRAAEALYISQPALSKYVSGLEESVGAQLFRRIGRELVPTETGSLYLEFARETLSRQHLVEAEAARLQKKQTIRIGIPVNLSEMLLDPICQFRQRHPQVKIELLEDDYRNTETALKDGKLNIAYVGSPTDNKSLCVQKVFEEEILLIVPAALYKDSDVQPGQIGTVDIHSLRDYPFILPAENTEFTNKVEHLFKAQGFEPTERFYTRDHSLVFHMAARGYGVGMAAVPPLNALEGIVSLGSADDYGVRLFRFTPESVRLPCYAVYSADCDPLIPEFVALSGRL